PCPPGARTTCACSSTVLPGTRSRPRNAPATPTPSNGSADMATPSKQVTVGIAGLGAIGLAVARRIDAGDLPGIALTAVAVRDEAKAKAALAGFRKTTQITVI